jgi:hypothetical protein
MVLRVVAICVFGSLAHAELMQVVQDSYIDPSKPSKNFGDKNAILVDGNNLSRGFIQFDLSALGGTVTTATLAIDLSQVVACEVDGLGEHAQAYRTVPFQF